MFHKIILKINCDLRNVQKHIFETWRRRLPVDQSMSRAGSRSLIVHTLTLTDLVEMMDRVM